MMARYQCFRTSGRGVCWRLLAGNNRLYGVAARLYPDLAGAVAAIGVTRAAAARAWVDPGLFIVERSDAGLWHWSLPDVRDGAVRDRIVLDDTALDETALARSAQGFARRIDASQAARRFARAAGGAGIEPALAIFESGQRGRIITVTELSDPDAVSRRRGDMWRQRRVP